MNNRNLDINQNQNEKEKENLKVDDFFISNNSPKYPINEVKQEQIQKNTEEIPNQETNNEKSIQEKQQINLDNNQQQNEEKDQIQNSQRKSNRESSRNKSIKYFQQEENRENLSDDPNFVADDMERFESSSYQNEKGKRSSKLKSNKPKTNKNGEKRITEITVDLNPFDTGIDLDEIRNKTKLENSDVILCLIEICTNSVKYGLNYFSKSRHFWEELFEIPSLSEVFKDKFKSETLRKYWRLIYDLNKMEEVVDITLKFKDQINKENVKYEIFYFYFPYFY